jgi:uncharacterized membrane protein
MNIRNSNLQINGNRPNLRSMTCLFVVGLICALLMLVFIAAFALLSAGIADYVYNARHAIPNPVERGKDIGVGMVVVFSALASLVISVPVSFPLLRFLFKLISKTLRCK